MSLSASARRVKGKLNFSLNFAWALGVSGETPRMVAPLDWNFLTESRNSQLSMVQPGVSARG